jgi:hypothetical protein
MERQALEILRKFREDEERRKLEAEDYLRAEAIRVEAERKLKEDQDKRAEELQIAIQEDVVEEYKAQLQDRVIKEENARIIEQDYYEFKSGILEDADADNFYSMAENSEKMLIFE